MDSSKAKSLFIISFLILNVLLAGQLWMNYKQQAEMVQWNQSSVDELKQILLSKKVNITIDIPKEAPKMNFLYVQYVYRSREIDPSTANKITDPRQVTYVFDPPVPLKKPSQAEQVEEALKDKLDWKNEQYDPMISDKDIYVFNQIEQGIPLFGITREIYVEDSFISAMKEVSVKVLSEGSERQVISAFSALRTLVENVHLPFGATIVDFRIGYHGQLYNSDVQVLAPSWRIVLKDGTIYFINAITGSIESSQQEKGIQPVS